MPIYEYQCPKCQKVFEEWVKVADAHGEEPCPDCGTASPRLISHTSFVLKGGGWYVTEYGYRKGVKENQDSKTDDSKKTDSKETSKSTETQASKESKESPKTASTSESKSSLENRTPKSKTTTAKAS